MTNGANIKTTDYLDGFQYNQLLLEFFPHSEGYVKATTLSLGNNPNYAFNYVYNYTDHLGNVRLSYAKDPQTGNLKILDESHYYPFGLKHQEYQANGFTTNPIQGVIIAPVANNPYKYKYNGKEWQDELGLGLYDYGWRNYMPDLGRWANIDWMSEKYYEVSPYTYTLNNPVFFVDIDGMDVYIRMENGDMILAKKENGNDKLMDSKTGDWIDKNIDSNILEGGVVNIDKNGLILSGDASFLGKVAGFLLKLSIYDQKEISFGYYKTDYNNEDGIIDIRPYKNNTYNSASPIASTKKFGKNNYKLFLGNHTHPSFWRQNVVGQWIEKDAGSMQPSNSRTFLGDPTGDIPFAGNAAGNLIWSREGVSYYDKNSRPAAGGYSYKVIKRWKSTLTQEYVKKVYGWKKDFSKPPQSH